MEAPARLGSAVMELAGGLYSCTLQARRGPSVPPVSGIAATMGATG